MKEEDEKKYRMNLALNAIKKYGEKAVKEELGVSRSLIYLWKKQKRTPSRFATEKLEKMMENGMSREYIDKDDSRREFLDKSFRVVKGRDERDEITAIYDGLRTVRK